MSVVADLKADLEQKRQGLIQEEERLTQEARRIEDELQLVRRYRQGIDEMLSQSQGKTGRTIKQSATGNRGERTRLLQAMIGGALEGVYPDGLSTRELLQRLQPHWSNETLTARQIGQLAGLHPAVIGDGSKWFWVPLEEAREGEQGA